MYVASKRLDTRDTEGEGEVLEHLNFCLGHFTDLARITYPPALAMQVSVESLRCCLSGEINESISIVAPSPAP